MSGVQSPLTFELRQHIRAQRDARLREEMSVGWTGTCWLCGSDLPAGSNERRLFCSERHRQKYNTRYGAEPK